VVYAAAGLRRRGGFRNWLLVPRRIGERGGHSLAPGSDAEGVDVLVLGEGDGLEKSLAEIGESGGGFALDLATGEAEEDAREDGGEIAGGEVVFGKERRDGLAGLRGSAGLCFLLGMEGAEVRGARKAQHATLAAVGEGEGTQAGTVFFGRASRGVFFQCGRRTANGAFCRHRSLLR